MTTSNIKILDTAATCYSILLAIGMTHAQALRSVVDDIKTITGCASCGFDSDSVALDFDHIDPAIKYRTRDGKLVHLADMVKGGRYSARTVFAEIAKCRVLCRNCHAIHTHRVQRG